MLVVVLAVALLSGCLRYTESLRLDEDDTVSGIIVIGARKPGASGDAPMPSPPPGQSLPKPSSDSPRIVVAPFEHDQETGYKVTFRHATFQEVSAFSPFGEKGGALRLSRDGDIITVSMTIDLTYAAKTEDIAYLKENAKAEVSLEVPGEIVSTDGQVDGDTITWALEPLALNTLEAVIDSPRGEPGNGGLSRSVDPLRAVLLGGLLTALAGAGWLLARRRLHHLRSTSPLRTGPRDEAVDQSRKDTHREAHSPQRAAPRDPFVEGALEPSPVDDYSVASLTSGRYDDGSPVRLRGGWPPPEPLWKEQR